MSFRRCSYNGCGVRGGKMHKIPARPPQKRLLWLSACSLSPNEPKSFLFICGSHFVGGDGPTPLHCDPILPDPVTPGRGDALDGLLKLQDSTPPEMGNLAKETLSTPPDENESREVSLQTTDDSNYIHNKEEAIAALHALMAFLEQLPDDYKRKTEMKNYFKDASIYLTTAHKDFAKRKLLDTRQDHEDPFPKKRVRRSLELHDDGSAAISSGSLPLPSMPETPPQVTRADKNNNLHKEGTNTKFGMASRGVQCQRAAISFYECLRSKTEIFHFYTGISKENFEVFYQCLGGDEVCGHLKYPDSYDKRTPEKNLHSFLETRDRLFMTLVRLRRGVPLRDLAHLFDVSVGWASTIFYTWTRFMALKIRSIEREMFVTVEQQDAHPNPLYDKFTNLRVIIDTTSFKIQHPYHFQMQANTYSNYKSTNTVNYLIGIGRCGGIIFVSKGLEGAAKDKQMVLESGILNYLNDNDTVMADRGFDIESGLNDINVSLIIPPFLGSRDTLTARETVKSKAVTSVRSFVEIAIGRIKDFRLIRYIIPMKLVPSLDDLVIIAAFLSNMEEEYVPHSKDND